GAPRWRDARRGRGANSCRSATRPGRGRPTFVLERRERVDAHPALLPGWRLYGGRPASLRWCCEMNEKETGRIEAFSDGVFAIAITLLVLDLHVPDWSADGPPLGNSLLNLWPNYLAFLTSFATIGVMWINHHRLFTHIKRSDNMLLFLNGLLLLGVTFVPFPTAVIARYIGHPGGEIAVMLYNGVFFVISIFFNALWRYSARGDRLLGTNVNHYEVEALTRQYRFGPIVYSVAFGLALLGIFNALFVISSVVLSLGL